jgi:hypothetical protein
MHGSKTMSRNESNQIIALNEIFSNILPIYGYPGLGNVTNK